MSTGRPEQISRASRGLLPGRGDPRDPHAVLGRREPGEAAPAATDVEQPHSGLQAQLGADQLQLVLLGLVEVVGTAPVAARVDHALVEHPFVHVVAEVVVGARVPAGPPHRLAVAGAGLDDVQCECGSGPHQRAQIEGLHLGDELVELVGVPPALLVGLAEAEFRVCHDPGPEAVVVDGDVSGPVATDLDPGCVQYLAA